MAFSPLSIKVLEVIILTVYRVFVFVILTSHDDRWQLVFLMQFLSLVGRVWRVHERETLTYGDARKAFNDKDS